MKIQLIRSATLRMEYARQLLLVDPYLAAKHSRPSFTGKSPNPLVDLPCAPNEVIEGIEMVLVSHLHSDHFDTAAQELLPKGVQICCQPGDEAHIRDKGFQRVTPVTGSLDWNGVKITRTPCQHGSGGVRVDMGEASGFVFQAKSEPTVYWAGDTILSDAVTEIIESIRPQIIITHSCGAVWGDGVLIVMDAAQTVEVCRAAPWSTVVATHMDSLDHATVSRDELRRYASAHGVQPGQLLIPADGETLVL
jgi:L-ascorbate metabolism protein UlaG (beta-lactamase superfamily)